jgi:hypothetical protein
MASLGFAVCAVIGPIGIQLPYETIADVDSDADANAIADAISGVVLSKTACRFGILKQSICRAQMTVDLP